MAQQCWVLPRYAIEILLKEAFLGVSMHGLFSRRQEAEKETRRLAVVQKELSHLDSIVSSDVSILRERIEAATAAYNEAK